MALKNQKPAAVQAAIIIPQAYTGEKMLISMSMVDDEADEEEERDADRDVGEGEGSEWS